METIMTPTELASLEALAKAATPGEWTNNWTGNETDAMDCVSSVAVGMIADCSQPVLYSEAVTVNPKANAAYIAAANPAAILSLIEENKRMREAIETAVQLRFDTYRAGNGRQVGIEGDDGEKCWIIPHDAMHGLETALAALEPQS